MKTILVDAVYAFVDKTDRGFEINMPLKKMLDEYPNNKIILTGANDEQIKHFGLDNMPYEVFTLKHDPEKSNPAYYETMLKHFNLKKEELCGRRRTKEIVVPRQILIFLLREEIDMPYKQIGAEIGGRDHTTIMHDYNKIKDMLLTNDSIDQEIRQIKNRLYST